MFYRLDENKQVHAIPIGELTAFVVKYGDPNRSVGYSEPILGATVSTVFLGTNISWNPTNRPQYFETMVINDHCEDQYRDVVERYETWDEALAGHIKWCHSLEKEVLDND